MKKVRFMYIKESTLSSTDADMLDSWGMQLGMIDDEYARLYAWTTSKSAFKEFCKVRNMNKFIIKSIKMNDDEYEEFKSKRTDTELFISRFSCECTSSVIIAVTKYEEELILTAEEYLSDDMHDMCLLGDEIDIIYDISKKKYKKYIKDSNILEVSDIVKSDRIMEPSEYSLNVINYVLQTFRFTFI